MEFQEFWRERERMCLSQNGCRTCSLSGLLADNAYPNRCETGCVKNPSKAEQIVEQWAKEHPIVTNADKFKEVFGASIGCYGFSCPPTLEIYGIDTMGNDEWLKQEYQPPKGEEG